MTPDPPRDPLATVRQLNRKADLLVNPDRRGGLLLDWLVEFALLVIVAAAVLLGAGQ